MQQLGVANVKCCNPIGPCSGKMVVRAHDPSCRVWHDEPCECDVEHRVWVAALHQPVWTQCDKCGYAPLPVNQLRRRKL